MSYTLENLIVELAKAAELTDDPKMLRALGHIKKRAVALHADSYAQGRADLIAALRRAAAPTGSLSADRIPEK